MIRKIISALLLAAVFSGCYYDKEELLYPSEKACDPTISFTVEIMPIIQTRCAIVACHDAGSGNIGGPFTNYTQIKNKAINIKSQVLSGAMPQGSSLSAAQIQAISCWVSNGALNN